MKEKKTLLKKQKILITALAILAFIVAIVCIAFPYIFKETLNTVYTVTEHGDNAEVMVYDLDEGRSLKGDIEKMLSGEMKNKLHVKKGEEDGVLYTFRKNNVQISYQPYIIPEIPKEQVKRITISNASGTFSVFNDGKGNFFIEGAEANLYNQQLLSELIFQARFMLADGYIENAGSPSDYGLETENCLAGLIVESMDGRKDAVIVGDSVIDGGQYYMKHMDKDNIYVMDSGIEIFFEDVRTFLNPVVISPIEEQQRNYIEKFAFSKNGSPFFACEIIPNEERVGVYVNQLHRMTYPSEAQVLNTYTLYDMFGEIGGLSGAGVVEYAVSKKPDAGDVLLKYGLDDSASIIAFSYGGTNYELTIGNSEEYDGETYHYVYSSYQDTVVMVPVSSMKFLDYDIIDLFQENVFQYNIADVASIELKTPSWTRNYVLEGTGEALKITESMSGTEMDAPSFRQFYISLLGVKIGGYSRVEGSGAEFLKHELSFVVTLKSGEKLNFEFYSESTMNCYMVVDGKGGFKTDRKQINQIIKHSDMLMRGEKITSSF